MGSGQSRSVNVAGPTSLHRWRTAVIYQVYLKSFADANGDGIGDIAGLISRLASLERLGVDALWISPWYPSPMHDGGYDVRDYRDIDPMFGTLADAEALIDACHDHGLRIVLDLVANHCSSEHPWFQDALRAPEGSHARDQFYFLDGRGADGELPPTDWISAFGGPAWTRTTNADGTPGQWYLHLFDSTQPDFNWKSERVQAEFDDVLRFWFDRGVDGFRLDAIPAIGKDHDFRDVGFKAKDRFQPEIWGPAPFWDADGVHDVLKRWRRVAQEYEPEKFFVGEVIVGSTESLARYIRDDELQSVFSIDLAKLDWDASAFSSTITDIVHSMPRGGSWLTWTLASHDEPRTTTRFAPTYVVDGAVVRDLETGRLRARAAYLLVLALPGAACVYQGEELGLDQVEDIPDDQLQDPIFARTNDRTLSRDGCRVPLPWTSSSPTLGFNDSTRAWLPVPARWASLAVDAQERDSTSFRSFFTDVLRARAALDDAAATDLHFEDAPSGVVSLRRGDLRCVVNFSGEPWHLDEEDQVVVASTDLGARRVLHANEAAWLRRRD